MSRLLPFVESYRAWKCRMPIGRLLCGLALALASATSSQAGLLISTLGQPTQGGAPFENTSRLYATDFLTGGSASSVTKLTIQAHNEDSLPHTLIAELWSGSSGNPGSLLGTFDSTIVVPAFSGPTQFIATDAGISLSANTIYWLLLRTGENPSFQPLGNRMVMDITSGQDINAGGIFFGVTSTLFKISTDGGTSFVNNSDFTPIYQLEGNVVPEPASLTLFGLGALLIGTTLGRRAAKPPGTTGA